MRSLLSTILLPASAAVGLALAGCSGPAPGPPAPAAAPSTSPPSAAPGPAAQGVRGQITAEDGATWTVTNAKNRALTVALTPQTVFGTRAAPATQTQFPVGTWVRVTGTRSGTTVTATRITVAPVSPAAPAQPGSARPGPPA
jgi:hypothetical protein